MEIHINKDGGTNFLSFYNISNPGLIVLLVDQTNYHGNFNSISKDVNNFISNLIISNVGSEGKIKDRCYLKLIVYTDEKYKISEGWLSFFADNPSKIEKVKRNFSDATGNLVEIETEEPIWIEDEQIGSYPRNIDFIEKQIIEWHSNKNNEYPESIIVHFYKDEKNEIAQLVRIFVDSKLIFKRPILTEKII